MANITFTLSPKPQSDGKHEINIRVYQGKINKRAGSGIFINPDYFEYEVDLNKNTSKGIRFNKPRIIATEVLKKDNKVEVKSGEIIVRDRVQTSVTEYHRDQRLNLDKLRALIEQEFQSTSKDDIKNDGEWLRTIVDKFHHPETYVPTLIEEAPKVAPDTIRKSFTYFLNGIESRIPTRRSTKKTGETFSNGTVLQHKGTEKIILQCLDHYQIGDIPIKFLGRDFYDKFVKYAYEKKYSLNTVGKHIKNLKAVINYLPQDIRSGCEFVEPGKCPKLAEDVDNIALTEEDLNRIAALKLNSDSKRRVRDFFLLMCWTGTRYSDLSKLNKKNIIDLGNGKAFSYKQKKTKAKVTIPIIPEIEKIMEPYGYELGKTLTNQVFNRELHEILKEGEFNEPVTITRTTGGQEVSETYEKWMVVSAHTGRRSYATNMYKRKFPTLMIMRITGHTTEKSFLKYIKITEEENAELMLDAVREWSVKQQIEKEKEIKNSKMGINPTKRNKKEKTPKPKSKPLF